MRRLRELCVVLLSGALWVVSVEPAISQQTDSQAIRVKQGEVFYLALSSPEPITSSYIMFRGKTIPVFQLQPRGTYGALVGIDLDEAPSRYDLEVFGAGQPQRYVVEVVSANFGIQELTLPQDKVELDEETLKRVEEEQEKILRSLSPVTTEKLWEGKFIVPVEGKVVGSFGLKRILNGQPRSPHSGEDFTAPQGTAVRAANTGKVALVGEYFFSGKSVIVDHGLGCYTMYFHLQDIGVEEGDLVQKGAVIGSVGATGRATGPHLHWGARVNGARVNPLSMIDLEEASEP